MVLVGNDGDGSGARAVERGREAAEEDEGGRGAGLQQNAQSF